MKEENKKKKYIDEEAYSEHSIPASSHLYCEYKSKEEFHGYDYSKARVVGFTIPQNKLPLVEIQFNELAKKWREETGGYSTMIHIVGNDNYLDIIGMGPNVLPLILKDLKKEADYWFVALKHIAKADPVPDEHYGDIEKMRQDWLKWGSENNYL